VSRTPHSPVKRWPGAVTLQDPLLYPQYLRLKQAMNESQAVDDPDQKVGLLLPGVCGCVEKWDLVGLPAEVTPETFPASPIIASFQLLGWLLSEVVKMISEAEDVPNS
jgi:hypothetical protein